MQKKSFLKIGFLIFSYLSCLAFVFPVNATAGQENTPDKQPLAKYSFVQSAAKAYIEVDKKENNGFIITLKNVSPYVTYFSERPIRNAGTISIEEFIKVWNRETSNSLKKNPPNADMHGTYAKTADKMFNAVLELTEPHYNPQTKTVTYKAKALNNYENLIDQSIILDHVVLFIDDVCLECWGH